MLDIGIKALLTDSGREFCAESVVEGKQPAVRAGHAAERMDCKGRWSWSVSDQPQAGRILPALGA